MSAQYRLPKGTKDFLPQEAYTVSLLENIARDIFTVYGYEEVRLPLLESIPVFARSLGSTSEIVQKQIFTIASKDGLCLRPEATAQVARAYIENNLSQQRLVKLFYIGPMFRGERPQKGRLRQFHHIGAEAIGERSPLLDVELIALARRLLMGFGLDPPCLEINSLGCGADRRQLIKLLKDKLTPKQDRLCKECRRRLSTNVLRILDCKEAGCKKQVAALKIGGSYLCSDCSEYFEQVLEGLRRLSIEYIHVPTLVRGLDYYTQTVFEFTSPRLGAQSAVGAGGRYDNLIADLGGPSKPACGFALGLERILLLRTLSQLKGLDVFVAYVSEDLKEQAFRLLDRLRQEGISCDMVFEFTSLKSQLRYCQKRKASLAVILGEEELTDNKVTLRDMAASKQELADIDSLSETIKNAKMRDS
jgi:histidyl-tRNA synthetase